MKRIHRMLEGNRKMDNNSTTVKAKELSKFINHLNSTTHMPLFNEEQDLSKLTIKKLLEDFMTDSNRSLCKGGIFTVADFRQLALVLSDEADNFMIFNNSGGRPFTIHFGSPASLTSTIGHLGTLVYAYKINGKETVLRQLPNY